MVEKWPWHILATDFKIFLDSKRDLSFDEFGDQPLVRINFFAREPWVLSEKYPGLEM